MIIKTGGSMTGWLKNKLLSKYIRENKKDRIRKIIALSQARSVGFLCSIDSEESYRTIFTLFSRFQQEKKNARLLAFIHEKEVPFYCLRQLTADYFCLKDLNWYGRPLMVQVEDFMAMEFDMLVDFTTEGGLSPLPLILRLSQARFIAGSNPHHQPFYDLFMDTAPASPEKLADMIEVYSQKLTGENV